MQLQASISQSLYWYKKGWPSYIGFIVFNFLNAIFYLFQYPFAKAKSKQSIRSVFKSLRLSIPYWLFNIPKWPRRFGSRAEPLIFKGARPIFFDSKETKNIEMRGQNCLNTTRVLKNILQIHKAHFNLIKNLFSIFFLLGSGLFLPTEIYLKYYQNGCVLNCMISC